MDVNGMYKPHNLDVKKGLLLDLCLDSMGQKWDKMGYMIYEYMIICIYIYDNDYTPVSSNMASWEFPELVSSWENHLSVINRGFYSKPCLIPEGIKIIPG